MAVTFTISAAVDGTVDRCSVIANGRALSARIRLPGDLRACGSLAPTPGRQSMITSSSPDIARRTARSQRTPPLRFVAVGLIAMMVLLLAAQFVLYGRNHSNPPILAEPAWKSAQTRTLFFRACGDCHSNQMAARIGSIALLTMLVSKHCKQGR